MNLIIFAEIVSFVFAVLSAGVFLVNQSLWPKELNRSVILILIILNLFISLSNFLEWIGVTAALDPFEDYLEVLIPVIFAFFLTLCIEKQQASALAKSEEQKRLIIDNMSSGFVLFKITSPKNNNAPILHFSSANRAFDDFLKCYPSLMNNPPQIERIFNTSIRDAFHYAISTGEPQTIEYYQRECDRWWQILAFIIKKEYLGCLCTDITSSHLKIENLQREREGLEKKVGEKEEELKETNQALKSIKSLSDIGLLAASVAHELRNPLGVIRTAIYNIRQKNKNSSIDKHIENIDKKINESEQIIRNLLNYARIKYPNFQPVKIVEILEDCIIHIKEKYPQHDVRVDFDYAACLPEDRIAADTVQLIELFSNILDNAYQAVDPKKGVIEVVLSFSRGKGECGILFKDNGIGISPADLPKIFDPFFTTRSKGTGLGLTVCQQLVELHNGKINISSIPGEGTEILVTLPVVQ